MVPTDSDRFGLGWHLPSGGSGTFITFFSKTHPISDTLPRVREERATSHAAYVCVSASPIPPPQHTHIPDTELPHLQIPRYRPPHSPAERGGKAGSLRAWPAGHSKLRLRHHSRIARACRRAPQARAHTHTSARTHARKRTHAHAHARLHTGAQARARMHTVTHGHMTRISSATTPPQWSTQPAGICGAHGAGSAAREDAQRRLQRRPAPHHHRRPRVAQQQPL